MTSFDDFSDLELQHEHIILEPGQMIIWEHGLTALREHCKHLEHRVKYFGDIWTKAECGEIMNDIGLRISQIIKSHQGVG